MQYAAFSIALRKWPLPRGVGRLTDRFLSHFKFKQNVAIVRTTDGFTMKVIPNDDWIGQFIYLTGEFDRSTAEVLIVRAMPGDVLIDIGANIGYISGCFLTKVPNSTAICVEPVPMTFALLEENLRQFSCRAIARQSLTLESGTKWMKVYETQLSASHTANNNVNIEITARSANEFFSQLERADVIKIDAEGWEYEVLQGAVPHFGRLKPRTIYFEHWGHEAHPEGNIGKLFQQTKYRVFSIRKLTSLEILPITAKADPASIFYLALPCLAP